MSFENLVGNQRIKRLLGYFVKQDNIPSAMLFTGDEGIGKKSFAIEFARMLFCQSRIGVNACLQCSSCKRINSPEISNDRETFKRVIFSGHSDLGFVLPYNKNILVEAIRDLEEEANMKPFEAQMRIFIIDDADKMNVSAANALLKILEEPPHTSCLILISSRPNTILPTILSRCYVLNFEPIPTEEMANFLVFHRKLPYQTAKILSECSRGSLGLAMTSDLQQLVNERETAFEVIKCIISDDMNRLLQISEEMTEQLEDFLKILEDLVRDMWLIKLEFSNEIVNKDMKERLERVVESIDESTASLWINYIENLRETMQLNLNKRVSLDALFIKMRITLAYGN